MVVGVYRHFSKPAYYHSGDGEATMGVPLRPSLKLAGVARLHEQWFLVPVEVDIQLIDMAQQPLGKTCVVLLVVDCGCQRPVTCLISAQPVGERDVGIALYRAIWHPYELDWPLRGIPERILVPGEICDDLTDIRKAADMLLSDVEIISNAKKTIAEKNALAKRGITEKWLFQAESVIKQLIEIKNNEGNLCGTHAREDAAKKLNVDTATIHRMVKRYEQNPRIDSLIPKYSIS
jgi:hypothetical protein